MYNTQLETFIHVVNAGSFNKAAEKAYITPTAIIKQINQLEASLEVKLFKRTHRGLILTKAGESLYQDAKYIIKYCKDSIARAKESMQEEENMIRVGTSPMTSSGLLTQLWSKIHLYCPQTKFQMVPYENTPENAKELLANLGETIDVVGGIFDETMLNLRNCSGFELSREPLCCAVSVHHPLAIKDKLRVEDLYGENLLVIQRHWSYYIDQLRDHLLKYYPQIHIIDFEFYNMEIFNRCENSNDILIAIPGWKDVHPFLKIIPVEWNYTIPFGILYSLHPSNKVKQFLATIQLLSDKNEL